MSRLPTRAHQRCITFLLGLACLAVARGAAAQDVAVPKFEAPKPLPKDPLVTAQAKGSLIVTSGNSRTESGVLGLGATRQTGADKLSFDGQIAYGRSSVLVPVLDAVNPTLVTGLDRRNDTTTNQWQARGRGDHFFTENNAGYLLGQIGADKIAGKRLVGGGQVGYSRQLYKDQRHTAVAELGYDFSYESYVEDPGKTVDPVEIHSARALLGEKLALSGSTAANASVEALFNLNRENAIDAGDPTQHEVAAFKDTRLVGKLGISTTLWKNLSFSFGVTLKYDQNPAPRPLPTLPAGTMAAPGFQPFADKLDTLTEATLVFTFI